MFADAMSLNPKMSMQHRFILTVTVLCGHSLVGVHAQEAVEAGSKRLISVAPRVSLAETFTNNVALSSASARAEQITEISPGIRLQIDGGRIKTYFDYALTELVYAHNSSPRKAQNALNAFGSFEALENRVFVDFSGSISQQTVSAFGAQAVDNALVNSNRAEVSTYRISPWVRGQMGSFADYEARYSRSTSGTDAQAAPGATTVDSMIKISGGRALGNLGWNADLGRQSVDYSSGRPTSSDYFNVGLVFDVNPQLKVIARAGREANNYTGDAQQAYLTNSLGLNWLPSGLSSVSLTRSQRSFGQAYNVLLAHRSARTVWKFSDTKDVSTTPSERVASIGSMYDLLFSQFASAEPNPVARAQMVENYLQTNGINPSTTVANSFLTSALSVQRRQELSFALLGLRGTITFLASRAQSSRLDSLSIGVDDLADAGAVHQTGLSVQYAHRLTPDYSLGILFSQQRTSGSASLQVSDLRTFNINVSGKLGKRSTVSLGARRTVADSETSPYSESALTGNFNVQF